MEKIVSTDYYVYVYKDPNTLEPFYIGKGKGYRATQHLNPSGLTRANHKTNKIKKLLKQGTPPIVEYVEEYLTEAEAFEIEKTLIAQYGRLDDGTGSLLNGTDGGEGTSGRKRPTEECEQIRRRQLGRSVWSLMSEDQVLIAKQKISASTTARNLTNNPAKRDDVRAKMSTTRKGRVGTMTGKTHSQDTLQKLSDAATRRPRLTCEFCNKTCSLPNYKQFHGANCSKNPNVDPLVLQVRAERMLIKSNKAALTKITCEHCGGSFCKGPYVKFHGNNCKNFSLDIDASCLQTSS